MSKEKSGIAAIYDKLQLHSFAIRAFGALLKSSDLWGFADEDLASGLKSNNFEASNLRVGLEQIIELYIAHQKEILNEGIENMLEGDDWFINRAKTIISMVEQGPFASKEVAVNELRGAIAFMDIVINEDGAKKDIAVELKRKCFKKIEELRGTKLEVA